MEKWLSPEFGEETDKLIPEHSMELERVGAPKTKQTDQKITIMGVCYRSTGAIYLKRAPRAKGEPTKGELQINKVVLD